MPFSDPPNMDLKDPHSEYKETSELPYETPPDVIDVDLVQAGERDKVMRRYAVLSSVAYNLYNTNYDKANENMREFLPLHEILPSMSDGYSTVIMKPHQDKPNDIIISYRGTQNLTDLAVDAGQIATGSPLEKLGGINKGYFRLAQDKYDEVKATFPNANITTTGHSLGGSLAYYIGKRNDVNSYIFNAGSSPLDVITDTGLSHTLNNTSTHYHVVGDLIGGSKALLGSDHDKLVSVEPRKWITDLVGTLGAITAGVAIGGLPGGVAGGAVGAGYSFVSDLHGLHNFLPPETFKDKLDPDDILYQWVKPISDSMEADALHTRRPIMRLFDKPNSIVKDDFLRRCFNPYDKRCKNRHLIRKKL